MSAGPLDTRGLPRGWRWSRGNEPPCLDCNGTGHKPDNDKWQCQRCGGWGVEFTTESLR